MLHGLLFAYALLLRTKKPMHGTPHIGNFFRWHLSGSLLLFFNWHYGSLRPFSGSIVIYSATLVNKQRGTRPRLELSENAGQFKIMAAV